jgi:hypothetical protein
LYTEEDKQLTEGNTRDQEEKNQTEAKEEGKQRRVHLHKGDEILQKTVVDIELLSHCHRETSSAASPPPPASQRVFAIVFNIASATRFVSPSCRCACTISLHFTVQVKYNSLEQ